MTPMLMPDDPEPTGEVALEVGSPGDHLLFLRSGGGTWLYAHNNDRLRPCTYELVRYWAPLRFLRAGPARRDRDRQVRADTRDEREAA